MTIRAGSKLFKSVLEYLLYFYILIKFDLVALCVFCCFCSKKVKITMVDINKFLIILCNNSMKYTRAGNVSHLYINIY